MSIVILGFINFVFFFICILWFKHIIKLIKEQNGVNTNNTLNILAEMKDMKDNVRNLSLQIYNDRLEIFSEIKDLDNKLDEYIEIRRNMLPKPTNQTIDTHNRIIHIEEKLDIFTNRYLNEVINYVAKQYQSIQRLLYKRKEERGEISKIKQVVNSIDFSLAELTDFIMNNKNKNDSKTK